MLYSALNVVDIHDSLSRITVNKRFIFSLLSFIRNALITKSPNVLYGRLLSQFARHDYQTYYVTEKRFLLPKSNTSMIQKTVIYRAMVELITTAYYSKEWKRSV